jgi:two-component system NtrC family sensor kinase
MNLSIRAKIVLITLMILFLTMGVNTLISSYVFTREYSDSLQSETFVIGQGLALQLDRLLRLGIPVEEIVGFEKQCQETVNKYEEISYAMVVDTDGKILFHNDPSRHGQVLSDSAMLKAVRGTEDVIQVYSQQGEKYYDVTIPALDIHGKHTAAVKIGFPAKLITQKTQGLVTYSVVVAFVSLGVATALLVFTLSAWVTSPLMRLLGVIQEIRKEGTYSAKRVEIDSKDEIGQLGSAFNQMISELKESHEEIRRHTEELEQRVADRTRNLQTAAEVARATTSVLEPDKLLHQTVDLVRDRFDLYYVGLFLLDEERRFAVLRAGTGEAGQKMLAQGHRLEIDGDSVIGQCTSKAEACIALDVGEEAVRFDSPLLPETRSEMALPLRARGEIIGALDVQSREPEAFSDQDVAVLQTLADQVATAISNARLYDQAQKEIIERKQAEEEIRQLKEFNEGIVQGMEEGIMIENAEGYITFVNPKMAELLGYTEQELVGKHWSEIIAPSCLSQVEKESNKRLEGISSRYETALLHKDGNQVPGLISARPLFKDGEYVGTLGVFTDLTEIKGMQQQLIQAGKLAAIGQLVAGVAHELNNPLASVVGYSELLLRAECSDEIKRDLERINRQGVRAARIVENLLTFARRREPRKKSINLNDVVERSLELQGHQLELDRISIVKELDEALPPAMADPFQMQQVFMNIIGNAHQALRDWGGERRLRVRSELQGDMIHLEFADSGPGIPAEVMGRLFEPFFTTREVGEGTGLGLSIAYGIVEAHGGRIWADSEVGKGTTFRVRLPISVG